MYLLTQLSIVLFLIGFWGLLLNIRSVIHIMISLEIMYLSINLILIATSIITLTPIGQVISLFILATAACEAAIGLSLLVLRFKFKTSIELNSFNLLRA